MRTFVVIAAAALALLLTAGATAYPGAMSGSSRLASVRVADCDRGAQEAVFRAGMRRVRGTERMRLRFQILERAGTGDWTRIRASGLNRWRRSRLDVRRFAYRQRVRGLVEGAAYRARVDFKWYDGDGEVIRRGRKRSGVCGMVPPGSNLQPRGVYLRPAGSGVRYTVIVRNAGSIAAPASSLALSVDGYRPRVVTAPPIDAGDSVALAVPGRPCVERVRAVVDREQLVPEEDEGDNGLVRPCPSGP